MAVAWEAQGRLRANFPRLAAQLGDLLQRGVIGHPSDLHEIAALAKRIGGDPEAPLLLRQAEEQANRVRNHVEMGRRLEKWVSGADLGSARSSAFTLRTLSMGGRPSLAGVYQGGDRLLVTLFASGPLAAWVAGEAARGGHFDSVLAPEDEYLGNSILRTAMLPEAPGFELSLRPRESGPTIERWRQRLLAGALAAAVLLVLLVGCFAFRDVSREVRLAWLRSSFVSSVTHELRTPLTSIRLLAETLRLKRTRDPATVDQMLGAIVDESERLARMVNNVLSFSRIEKGAHRYRRAAIDLTEVVNDAVRRFQYILKQGEFRLHQESDGKPLRVLADAEALSQALLNLLDNAVKYSGLSREILLGVHRRGKEVEIRVTDHGIGVPPAEQRRIFESFYRAPGAARETTGAGLGLALVQHFAEAHGGRAAVASGPGRGSAFSLWLPLMENDGQDSDR
jgi:signal transduction histidine kinase